MFFHRHVVQSVVVVLGVFLPFLIVGKEVSSQNNLSHQVHVEFAICEASSGKDGNTVLPSKMAEDIAGVLDNFKKQGFCKKVIAHSTLTVLENEEATYENRVEKVLTNDGKKLFERAKGDVVFKVSPTVRADQSVRMKLALSYHYAERQKYAVQTILDIPVNHTAVLDNKGDDAQPRIVTLIAARAI